MSWFLLSLLAAVSLATADALTKKYFSNLTPYEMGLIRLGYALPWLVVSLFFITRPTVDRTYFLCLIVGLPLECIAFYCYMKAIKVSPLSLSLPFLAFTPIFVILTGWILLDETISPMGGVGIVLIVIGSYCINLGHIREGIMAPFMGIFKEPGSRLMLFVSLIYSITATLGKLGIIHSDPYFFGISYFILFTLLMYSFFPVTRESRPSNLLQKPLAGMVLGAVMSCMIISHMLAISKIQAAYMLSLKRTSLLFGVLYGAWLFKEERIGERFGGAVIMITGVFFIGWFS